MLQAVGNAGRDRKLTVRPLRLAIDARTPRHWMAGDPFETHLLNALSLTFPAGERFFMRSVRALRDRASDPRLEEQVKGFLAQESLHSREHSALNQWLDQLGFPARYIEKDLEKRITERSSRRSPLDNLAVTCALEHFTAIMAKAFLTNPELRARVHESVRPLWVWHAIEELDHKAVAFDVYKAAGGGHERRVTAMVFATIGLISTALIVQWHLMKRDGEHRNLRSWARGALRYYAPGGLLASILPDYVRYFRRDFHPWDEDDQPLIDAAQRELAGLLKVWD